MVYMVDREPKRMPQPPSADQLVDQINEFDKKIAELARTRWSGNARPEGNFGMRQQTATDNNRDFRRGLEMEERHQGPPQHTVEPYAPHKFRYEPDPSGLVARGKVKRRRWIG
jgi:hypothetical protein